jgi:hypothetical protein
MNLSYDAFTGAFLDKVSEYKFGRIGQFERMSIVDGYMKRAISAFKKICKYDLTTTADDVIREFVVDVDKADIDELTDIISEGMVVQWLKPYTYSQDNLELGINTRDFTRTSAAELLMRINNVYSNANKTFTQMMREYSYNHGDLTDLHL